jgi:hypothetical protein
MAWQLLELDAAEVGREEKGRPYFIPGGGTGKS